MAASFSNVVDLLATMGTGRIIFYDRRDEKGINEKVGDIVMDINSIEVLRDNLTNLLNQVRSTNELIAAKIKTN